MLFQQKKDLIGIDIGSSAVKLVQLREVRNGYQLVVCGVAKLPTDAVVDNTIVDAPTVAQTIRDLISTHKVSSNKVAVALSGHSVIVRKITMPKMSGEQLDAAIEWEAEQYIPFRISEVNLDSQILGPNAKDPSQMDVVLVAAKKDIISATVSLLADCKLEAQVVDVDCFALANVLEVNYGQPSEELFALIDLGASSTIVNIHQGGVPIFTRHIQFGGNNFLEELQRRLGLSRDEAENALAAVADPATADERVNAALLDTSDSLISEIQRTLDFFHASSMDERPRKFFLTGGLSQLAVVRNTLGHLLGAEVEVVDPWRRIAYDKKVFDPDMLRDVGSYFAVAVGLALRRVGDK